MVHSSLNPRLERSLLWLFIGLGLTLHIFAASRTWIGGDEAHLLRLGAAFSSEGRIIPFAKLLSGGGTNPGILLQLFFGIPMYLFGDFRSPMLLVILMHCAAYLLVSSVLKEVFGRSILLPFTLLYWLSPWRIFYGSLLWEPAFIYLPAALHLWSCYKIRDNKSFIYSGLCFASVIWAMQVHNSFIILAIATLLLFWKKEISLQWQGAIFGIVIGGLTLIPSIISVITGNLHYDAQESQGFIGKGLLTVAPTLKGILYWFNLGAVEMVRNLKETSFAQSPNKFIIYILQFICIATVAISIIASWWYFRPLWKFKGKKLEEHQTSGSTRWLRNYALSVFISLVGAAALSPIVLQGWMVVIALAAATIPVSIWVMERSGSKMSVRTKVFAIISYGFFEVVIVLVLIVGLPIFHRTGQLPDSIDPVRDQILLPYIPPAN